MNLTLKILVKIPIDKKCRTNAEESIISGRRKKTRGVKQGNEKERPRNEI